MKIGNVGIRIKQLRKEMKLTQKQLAEKINKTESSIQKYESGNVEIPHSVIENIAETLNTTVSYLLGFEGIQKEMKFDNIFNELIELQGYILELHYCNAAQWEFDPIEGCFYDLAENNKICGCEINNIKRRCIDCDESEVYYTLKTKDILIKIPYNEIINFQKELESYLKFKLTEIINNYKR